MSDEIQFRHSATGKTLYAVLRNADGECVVQADGDTETQVNANWGTYDIPMTETPASGYHYIADMVAADAGYYHGEVYERAGASPALSDVMAGVLEEFYWDGDEVVQSGGSIETQGDVIVSY